MDAYGKLWDRMAMRYKDKPGVIGFEPLNEPGWGTADITTFEATTLTSFFSAMAPRLRQLAPATLVFFDATGPDAGTLVTSMGLPSGDGLVFAPHYYQLAAYAGQGNPDKVALDLQRWANQGKQWNVPVLVGEFGTVNKDQDPVTYIAAHFDAFDKLGLNGTQWEYSASKDDWNSEDFSVVRGDGTENPMAAALVRAYPRAVAGDDVTFAFDTATRGFTLSYTAAAGITEVMVPARLYPKGYDVTASNACADSSTAGRLLVQATAAGAKVDVKVTAR
jgi:endoglycosylceramidase